MKDTGHGFECTVFGCRKVFGSEAALRSHLSSAAHTPVDIVVTPNRKPTELIEKSHKLETKVERAPSKKSGVMVVQATGAAPMFRCGVSGCQKTFQSKQARRHHIQSAVHNTHGKNPVKAPQPRQNRIPVIPSGSRLYSNSTTLPSEQKTPPGSRWSSIPSANYLSTTRSISSAIKTASIKAAPKYSLTKPIAAPTHSISASKRCVIALDCEMVNIRRTASELARLSAIDFLTGEILIDTLVQPCHTVTDWRTEWSGITAQAIDAAVASGTALKGSTAARKELFKYMDSTTILVGHAVHHDLAALGILHNRTVDSALLAKEAVGNSVKRDWGLKVLCKELLKIDVQNHGKSGHDSVEDAFAAREVVLWCLEHPEELKSWGARKKAAILEQERINKAKRDAKRSRSRPAQFFDDESDDTEILYLSTRELNELCHYPEWYDNWSD